MGISPNVEHEWKPSSPLRETNGFDSCWCRLFRALLEVWKRGSPPEKKGFFGQLEQLNKGGTVTSESLVPSLGLVMVVVGKHFTCLLVVV